MQMMMIMMNMLSSVSVVPSSSYVNDDMEPEGPGERQ